MNCPHCNMPARLDYPLEYTCASYIHVGLFTRSPICYGKEIEQLKEKVARLEKAGDAVVEFHSFATFQAWNIAKEDK